MFGVCFKELDMTIEEQEHSEQQHLAETQSSVYGLLICLGSVGIILAAFVSYIVWLAIQCFKL